MGRYSDIRLAVFGDYMWDQWLEPSAVKMCPGQPAMDYVSPFRVTEKPGGAGNQVMNVLNLGGKCDAFGIYNFRNDNDYDWKMREAMRSNGCGWRFLSDDDFTTHFKRYYEYQGMLLSRVSNHDGVYDRAKMHNLHDYFRDNVDKYDGLVIADYNKGSMSKVVIGRLIDTCLKNNIPAFVDPKFDNWGAYAGATIFKPNRKEFSQCNEPEAFRRSVKNLIITDGDQGMMVTGEDAELSHIPARSGEVYDINGAGDSVMAAMCLEYIKTDGDILKAAHVGNIAGGICVGHKYTYQVSEEDLRKAGAWDE